MNSNSETTPNNETQPHNNARESVGSGSETNVAGQSKKRKNAMGSRTDKGWKYGYPVEGDSRKVICKFCSKTYTGGIYRLKHHLACTRQNVEACISVPDDVKIEMLTTIVNVAAARGDKSLENVDEHVASVEVTMEDDIEATSKEKGKGMSQSSIKSCFRKKVITGGSTQTTINQLLKKDVREEACRQIGRFFYTSAIPFNCVKNPEFDKMLELVAKHGPGFKPPSFHEIREKFLKKEVEETMSLIDQHRLEWQKKGCTIMSDGWTDRKRRSIVNFMVNSPKGTIFLCSKDVSDISKTADKIFEMLDEIVEQVGEENVVQVITDNAANYKAAGQLLMEKRKRLFWTPCAAHCIDLMLEDFEKKLKIHNVTIKKGRKITTFIYSRTMLISMLKHFTKGRDLIRPAVTRFATAYLTLGCLFYHKGPLMTMFSSRQWKSSRFATLPDGRKVERVATDSRFWKNVTLCLKVAYPLIKVLRLVDGDGDPAMPFMYDAMEQAKQSIQANFRNVKKSYEPILKIIDDRWDAQLHRPLHAAAYYLNPRFHYTPELRTDCRIKLGLYDCIDRMLPLQSSAAALAQLVAFKSASGTFGKSAVVANRKVMRPDEWWDAFGDHCPDLQKVAIRILSLTCSSSGCERNWSAFEMVLFYTLFSFIVYYSLIFL